MAMKIETSLDWNEVETKLKDQLHSIGYTPDLEKMLKNIDNMVDELSKLEVQARRIHSSSITQEKVNKINQSIDHLEKLILIARLML